MVDSFLAADGTRLAYDVVGQGPALLCLAGLTRNMDDFEPVVAQFADRAQVIRLDACGRGASDFSGPARYTIQQETLDAIALLDHLGLEKTAILGTSRGGLQAMVMGALAPQRLTGVLLNDIGPEMEAEGLDAIMGYLGYPCVYTSYEDAADRLPQALGAQFPGVSRAQWHSYARRLWTETSEGLALRYDPRLRDAVEAGRTEETPDLWPLFAGLSHVPLALLRGENSTLLSRDTATRMRAQRPDLIYAEVKDRGHVPFLDEPESIATIAAFLDAIETEVRTG